MFIYRPIRSNYKTQGFGENKACVIGRGRRINYPIRVRTKRGGVCPAGTIPFYPAIGLKGHNGEDWATWHGEPVYFPCNYPTKWWGELYVDSAQGMNLDVTSLDPIPFDELPKEASQHARDLWEKQGKKIHVMFRFTHVKEVFLDDKEKIRVGTFADKKPQMRAEIKFGEKIALADNTGASSGDHLHFSMKFKNKSGMTVGSDNGYYGAVDMKPYFVNVFTLDALDVKEEAIAPLDRLYQLAFRYRKLRDTARAEIVENIANLVRAFNKKVVAFIKRDNNIV